MPLEPHEIEELLGRKREKAEDELLEYLDLTQQDVIELERQLAEMKSNRLKYIMDCVTLDIPQKVIAEVLNLPPNRIHKWVCEARKIEKRRQREFWLTRGVDPDTIPGLGDS